MKGSVKWDVLMILDACRYDYFERHYRKYMNGELRKKISCATWTLEWLAKTFVKECNDIVYISGNPFVNSKMKVSRGGYEFCARDKFFKVIDVWDSGWSEKLGCVMPLEVNRAFLKAKNSYSGKRFVLHYMQPHPPFVSLNINDEVARAVSHQIGMMKVISENIFYTLARSLTIRMFGYVNFMELKKLIGMSPDGQLEYAFREYGLDEVKRLYAENVRLVLKAVSEILPEIDGTVVITSDHGEMLGEHGIVGHPLYRFHKRYRELVEVPYLVVEGKKNQDRDKTRMVIETHKSDINYPDRSKHTKDCAGQTTKK